MTKIYLLRHSMADKNVDFRNLKESFENINKKYILSVEGEKKAQKYSEISELNNLNMDISNNYVRSIATAK